MKLAKFMVDLGMKKKAELTLPAKTKVNIPGQLEKDTVNNIIPLGAQGQGTIKRVPKELIDAASLKKTTSN